MKIHGLILGIVLPAIAALFAPPSRADDIDIFIDAASGAGTPSLVFLLDNTSNFSKASQQWGPPDNEPTQGQAELDAIFAAIQQIYNARQRDPSAPAVRIGVAMLNANGNPGGAYFRFAPRDITVTANFNAFKSIFGYGTAGVPAAGVPATSLYAKIQDSSEKINESSKDESGALYEIYKFYNKLPAYKGQASKNSYADYPGNGSVRSPAGQGLTSGFALDSSGNTYNGPENSCAKQYIVYIANNSQGNQVSTGFQSYESLSSGGAILPVTYTPDFWTDEWTRFLSQHSITTYILDAFNAQQNVSYSAELKAAAGSDKYYQVGSETAMVAALSRILTDIQAVNSAFAATSMPASAANRSVSQNEVFLGVFRPGDQASPRWYGNLKRYQVLYDATSGDLGLGDSRGAQAINSASGFLAECAASWWTADTTQYQPASSVAAQPYWSLVPNTVAPASLCPAPSANGGNANPAATITYPAGVSWSPLSDLPDGPFVEKGGAAEVLRRGNVAATTAPTWKVNRAIKTLAGSTLVDFTTTTSGVSLTALGVPSSGGSLPSLGQIVDFVQGWDSADVNGNGYTDPNAPSSTTETRPSLHGDVIHSTPLPVTYNDSASGVVVYYGSNDGMFHALNADTGIERWAFLAPEFLSRMYRQYANNPAVRYPNMASGITPSPLPRDYFFDGSTGLYQSADNTQFWIYPSMRRGGRMIYAFDVSPASGAAPALPKFLWKAGCPNMGNDVGCTTGMSAIGQTWSKAVAGVIKNGPVDTAPAPVVVFGGGYDSTATLDLNGNVIATSCEDQNVKSPTCSNRKGNVVYIVDAKNGPSTLLKTFTLPSTNGRTPGSVAGDIGLLDANNDGYIDYAYLADTNGFVYRIDFVDGPSTLVPLTRDAWSIHQIAGTTGGGRKFLFEPTLFFNHNKVYVGLGSGDREHPLISQYPYTAPVQNRFYLFIDDPAMTTYLDLDGVTMANAATDGLAGDGTATGGPATCKTPAALPTTIATLSGWYLPMTANGVGEQVVTPAVIVSGQLTWGTNRPMPQTISCTNNLGEARGYLVDLVNGSGAIGTSGVCGGSTSTQYAGGGLPIPPDINVAKLTDNYGRPVYVGTCIGCPPKNNGSANGSGTQPVSNFQPSDPFDVKSEARRRVYWFTPGSE